jgi:hypothetical protein
VWRGESLPMVLRLRLHDAGPTVQGRPKEFHSEPLTEPDMKLSRDPAPATA